MRLLLDTHVALWWMLEPKRLSAKARRAIDTADERLLSPMTFWEIVRLERASKIRLDRAVTAWIDALVRVDRVSIAEVTTAIAVEASLLEARGFHGDPVDQFLYASARQLGVRLCTKDGLIQSFAESARDVRIVW